MALGVLCPAGATPEFARRFRAQSCNVCHTVVPKLNERGLDFLSRGYRPDPRLNLEPVPTVPLSLWLTQNYDRQISHGVTNFFLGKAEVISGGALGDSASYFVEWRLVSLEPRADGSLRDRSGRFEDLWINVFPDPEQRWSITVGQFRPLQQIDPGRKLSISTPLLFTTSLEGARASTPRRTSLNAFSTAERSPSVAVAYQSIQGPGAADGLFHVVTVPFPGEFSLPLNALARREASFEFDGTPKGVVLETYYRRGLNSIGAHGFIGRNQRWEAVGVGELNLGDFYFTAGAGFDNRLNRPARFRYSLEAEYMPTLATDEWRPGLGVRWEDVTNDGHTPNLVPYFSVSFPNQEAWTSLLQVEYRTQAGGERFRLDYSIIF
jgi:hypothetical protein